MGIKRVRFDLFLCILLLAAACAGESVEPPLAMSTVTAVPIITLPTAVPTTAISTATPQPTLTLPPLPTVTPPPSPTPSPTLLPTLMPSSTPSVYEDIWVSGYRESMNDGRFFTMGNSEPGFMGGLLLEPADETVAAELTAVPTYYLLILTGNLYLQTEPPHRFVVKEVELIDAVYTPETSLDATYVHHNPNFQFDYPSILYLGEGDFRVSSWPPNTGDLRPGYGDFPQIAMYMEIPDVESAEAYVTAVLESLADDTPREVAQLQIGAWATTRIAVHGFGTWVYYVVVVDEEVVVFWGEGGSAPFIERVLATMRQ